MITACILLLLMVFGIYLSVRESYYDLLGFIMSIIFGLWFSIHTLCIWSVGYYFERNIASRNAFEKTLHDSRKYGNEYETATIVKEVAEWNSWLALEKYDHKHWYHKQFVDDRIESIQPIK